MSRNSPFYNTPKIDEVEIRLQGISVYHEVNDVRRHRLQIRSKEQATKRHIIQNRIEKMRLKQSALNTFVFYISMIACYFPSYVLLFLFGISYSTWKTEWTISTTVVFMNSSLNPILFCWRIRHLRVAAVKTVRYMLCTTTD